MEVTHNWGPGLPLLEADGKSFVVLDPSGSCGNTENDYLQTIETLKMENRYLLEENAAQNNKIELLEIQLKFILNKFTELEKFMESRK